jgi:hypothetical protein
VSPNTQFRPDQPLDSPIVERMLGDESIVLDVGETGVVIAMRSELLVHRSVRLDAGGFDQALSAIAEPCGTLGDLSGAADGGQPPPDSGGPAVPSLADVEIWRLRDAGRNAIDETRRLRRLAPAATLRTAAGVPLTLPAVSPNHVSIVSPHYAGCPAGPPHPTPVPPGGEGFIPPPADGDHARVVVIDTGYIETDPPHEALDARVTSVPGHRLDTSVQPPRWCEDPPDEITTDADGRLLEIVGHGTFIAGLIAHLCPAAKLTVVGQRDEDVLITGEAAPAPEQKRLFSSEVALAHALLTHADADVISLGFSFPTLDDQPSLPFAQAMEVLTGPQAPRPGVAVVAPAGNEESASPFWPAALPNVIGVAATGRRGLARASFSNWGPWADCCARGQDVVSTYLHWTGPVQGDPVHEPEAFSGWARWDGTSFAAPKVAAAIARLVARDSGLSPVDAFARLVSGATDVAVSQVTDHTLSGLPGVTLTQLHIH